MYRLLYVNNPDTPLRGIRAHPERSAESRLSFPCLSICRGLRQELAGAVIGIARNGPASGAIVVPALPGPGYQAVSQPSVIRTAADVNTKGHSLNGGKSTLNPVNRETIAMTSRKAAVSP